MGAHVTPVCVWGFSSWFHRWLRRRRTQKLQRKCAHCYLKDEQEAKEGDELCDNCKLRNWLSNYRLNNVDSFSLFNEFLEMGPCNPRGRGGAAEPRCYSHLCCCPVQ